MVDPNDFIIVRKRKKYKFAKFSNAENCFELEQWEKRKIDVVEVGAGNGLFLVELAARYPDSTFVAIDVKADRLQMGAYQALERQITNIFFVRARADQIEQVLMPYSIKQLWLAFSDPFPRKRSARRRMTHPLYLEMYKRVLSRQGALYCKHDSREFFHWTLEQFVEVNWSIDELSFNLHESNLPEDYKVLTTYEKKWLHEGSETNFVKATPKII